MEFVNYRTVIPFLIVILIQGAVFWNLKSGKSKSSYDRSSSYLGFFLVFGVATMAIELFFIVQFLDIITDSGSGSDGGWLLLPILFLLTFLMGYLAAGYKDANINLEYQKSRLKKLIIITLSIDILLIGILTSYWYEFYYNIGYYGLPKEQAIEIASNEINPGVKYEIITAEKKSQVIKNYAWEVNIKLYDKRDKSIGVKTVYIDNKIGQVDHSVNYKATYTILSDGKPLNNVEVIAVAAIDKDSLWGGANDYGLTNEYGKIDLTMSKYNPTKVYIIDKDGYLESLFIENSTNNSYLTNLDFSNSPKQDAKKFLEFLEL